VHPLLPIIGAVCRLRSSFLRCIKGAIQDLITHHFSFLTVFSVYYLCIAHRNQETTYRGIGICLFLIIAAMITTGRGRRDESCAPQPVHQDD
jgi:hypothetical protein